jgi:hypothetical protein
MLASQEGSQELTMQQKLLSNNQYLFIQKEKQLLQDSLLQLTDLNLSAESIQTLQNWMSSFYWS